MTPILYMGGNRKRQKTILSSTGVVWCLSETSRTPPNSWCITISICMSEYIYVDIYIYAMQQRTRTMTTTTNTESSVTWHLYVCGHSKSA